MMDRLEARGRAVAERGADRAAARLEARAREAIAGVTVTREGDAVTIAGRGLGKRMLRDPALRWLGGLLR